MPISPIISGSIKNPMSTNPKVLRKDMIPEIFPLERAVNNIEENILNPIKTNAILNVRKPSSAMLKARLPGEIMNEIKLVLKTNEAEKVAIDTIRINPKLYFTIFCSCL